MIGVGSRIGNGAAIVGKDKFSSFVATGTSEVSVAAGSLITNVFAANLVNRFGLLSVVGGGTGEGFVSGSATWVCFNCDCGCG